MIIEDKDALSLCNDVKDVLKRVEKYITDTPNWIYYWVGSCRNGISGNIKIKEFLAEYGEDWEANVRDFKVNYSSVMNQVNVSFRLYHGMYSDDDTIHVYANLPTFRHIAKTNFAANNTEIYGIMIEEAEADLKYHREQIERLEAKVADLKKKYKE